MSIIINTLKQMAFLSFFNVFIMSSIYSSDYSDTASDNNLNIIHSSSSSSTSSSSISSLSSLSSIATPSSTNVLGRNGYVWSTNQPAPASYRASNTISFTTGPSFAVSQFKEMIDAFNFLIDGIFIDHAVS